MSQFSLDAQPGDEGQGDRSASQLADFTRRHLEGVYRYLLAFTGDVAAAQTLTAEAFHQALRSLHLPDFDESAASIQLMGIASGKRRRYRQGDALASLPPDAGATRSAQEQLAWRAQLNQLSTLLSTLPPAQAEALGLTVFAGLSDLEAGAVLGRRAAMVKALVENGLAVWELPAGPGGPGAAAVRTGLDRLAADIQVDAGLAAALEADARRFAAGFKQRKLRVPGLAVRPWMLAVLIALVLALAGLPTLARVLAEVPKTAPPQAALPEQGYLAPPTLAECQKWQAMLGAALGQPVSLQESAPYVELADAGADKSGTACELSLSGLGSAFQNTYALFEPSLRLFRQQGFAFSGRLSCDCGDPQNKILPSEWYGRGVIMQQANLHARFSVGWSPVDDSLCAIGQTEKTCQLQPNQRLVTLRLDLAVDPISPNLKKFFSLWSAGNSDVTELFTPPLRARLPGVAALDDALALDHTQIDPHHVVWSPLSSTGDQVTLQAVLDETAQLPETVLRLDIGLVQVDGNWQIQEVSAPSS